MQSALENFVEEGYERATMQNIAKRAGVGKGTTYEYFPSKEALLGEVLITGINRVIDELMAELRTPGTVQEKVTRMYRKNLELFLANTALREIMLNDFGKIPQSIHMQLLDKQLAMVNLMEAVLEEGMNTKEIANVHPRVAASVILHGLKVIYTYQSKEDESLDEALDHQLEIVFGGLQLKE
ncbi:TetR/AcrR family transcriptional regulator [Halalkalibacter urbisdiaboli]|uniref:TetR/AcrR family transcriptional regulator n=1 Tax=Halalkalibacter urbisdiaboli TaxID=1960589 RepID=UPI0013FE0E10|nr:TetR/AcrR family transcriptional regulator [Halalkalibacter urbisdiaboli]